LTKAFYDADADLNVLSGQKIAVLGYGSQGHAQAQNLKDSGCDVVVGLRKGSKSWALAESHGLTVTTVAEAAAQAQIIQILLPDESQAQVYATEIAPHLTEGKTLMFSHGFNIHFGQIVPPENVDVVMIAPKSPGHLVRRMYVQNQGVPSLLAIHQDYTGKAREVGLAYAKGIGSTRAGVIETTFKEETETDLFGEQAVLCGGLTSLIKAGFETLVEAGYQPEIAYFECLNEMKLIVDMIYEGGLGWMRYSVSDTCQFGDLTRGPRLINDDVRQEMKQILGEIQSGQFAKEWILENHANRPVYKALTKKDEDSQLEQVGRELREMMPWLKAEKA